MTAAPESALRAQEGKEEAPPPPVNSSFSTIQPDLQIAWDSTSLGALKTCPRYYQYSIIEGYASRIESVHLKFGIEFHAALELYDRKRAVGTSHDDALLAALRHAIVSTWDPILNRPWTSDLPAKNRETLIRSIVWYLDQFADDPLETIILRSGAPAVELSFRFEIDITAPTGENYMLCGHLDKLARWQDRVWIKDVKTTQSPLNESYFARYSPDNQMSLYDLAGSFTYHDEPIAGLIIDAAQVQVTGTRFQRGIISRTPAQRDEWYQDLAYWLRMAEGFAAAQYWPMNDKSCSQYGGCPYRSVCAVTPDLRPQMLEQLYSRRTWDPLQTREV